MKHLIILLVILNIFIACKGQTGQKTESFQFLSEQELNTKSNEELRLIRNEVFARKGYVFKSEELQEYFSKKTWYKKKPEVTVSLSADEQNYIDNIKIIEGKTKKSTVQIEVCLKQFNDNIKNIYPLKGSDTWSFGDYFDSYNEENSIRFSQGRLREGLSCDGYYVYNIDCYTEVENILFTAWCNDNPIFHVISIKDDKVIKKVKVVDSSLREGEGNIIDGYYDIDFKLDHDDLEVYKIYRKSANPINPETKEDLYKTVETGREVTKYKLTDTGLVEL